MRLSRLDRYEARAFARRQRAIRDFDAAVTPVGGIHKQNEANGETPMISSKRNFARTRVGRANRPACPAAAAHFVKTTKRQNEAKSKNPAISASVFPYATLAIARVTAAMKAARASGSAAPCGA
jgi:hypothetical protein